MPLYESFQGLQILFSRTKLHPLLYDSTLSYRHVSVKTHSAHVAPLLSINVSKLGFDQWSCLAKIHRKIPHQRAGDNRQTVLFLIEEVVRLFAASWAFLVAIVSVFDDFLHVVNHWKAWVGWRALIFISKEGQFA